MPKIDLRLWEIYLEVSEINLGVSKMFRRRLVIRRQTWRAPSGT